MSIINGRKPVPFEDLRVATASAIDNSHAQKRIWYYLAKFGCYVAGAPYEPRLTPAPAHAALGDPKRSPFERLIYWWRGPGQAPRLAYRLKPRVKRVGPRASRQLQDAKEVLDWRVGGDSLTVVELASEEGPPTRLYDLTEPMLWAGYGPQQDCVLTRWV